MHKERCCACQGRTLHSKWFEIRNWGYRRKELVFFGTSPTDPACLSSFSLSPDAPFSALVNLGCDTPGKKLETPPTKVR